MDAQRTRLRQVKQTGGKRAVDQHPFFMKKS